MQGSLAFSSCFHLGGDLDNRAVSRSRSNLDHNIFEKKLSVASDISQWDATRLPLRNSCADVVVSDLPFGKRSGSKLDNRVLYLRALQETARVTRPSTGRAVLLTHDKNSMIRVTSRAILIPLLVKKLMFVMFVQHISLMAVLSFVIMTLEQ